MHRNEIYIDFLIALLEIKEISNKMLSCFKKQPCISYIHIHIESVVCI